MRLLICLILSTALSAATIEITVKNDAGTTLGVATVTTTDVALARINAWRLTQFDGATPPVLKYATNVALLKSVFQEFFKTILPLHPTAAIQAELDKITAARAVIETLKANAAQ